MRTILLRGGVFLFLFVCAVGAQAQSVDCNSPTSVAPDGRTLSGSIPAVTTFWFSVAARGTSSYAAEANYPTAADSAFPGLDAFAPGDVQPACSGTSSLSPRNIRLFDPTLPNGNRVSVTAASAMTILVSVTNSTMQPRDFTVRVAETTLFNPLWSTFGGFETFYRLQNTTRDSLTVTLRLINDAGTTVATHNQPLAANSTAPTLFTGPGPAPGLGVTDNQAGQAILTHDGPPGALQVDGFLGLFTATPVVLPIKIVPAREGVSVSRLQPSGGGGGGGAVNSVTAGDASITIGGTMTDPTVAVNTAVIQSRVIEVCPPGSSIRTINEPGMVECETDTGADVAGTGAATTAARSDHTHEAAPLGNGNTGVGVSALAANMGPNNTAMGSGALANNSVGQNNTAMGSGVLDANTSGNANTAVGANALGSNQTGGSNTAMGRNALAMNTGSSNTAVGADTMAANTSGIQNTAVGDAALNSNLGGANNTAVGRSALALNTSGSENVAVGNAALLANSTGNSNIAIGVGALQQNTVSGNTAVGDHALTANSTGANNTAVGVSALNVNNASGNTAVGANALDANTTGPNNTAVGQNALGANATAGSNTAVGASALAANTAAFNTAVGFNALTANTSASGITAVGNLALGSNTTGGFNTAVGSGALSGNTTGAGNTAVGHSALVSNTIGTNNTAVGSSALNVNTGSNNTAVGSGALVLNAGANDNTAVGRNALAVNTAAGNTAVGASALDVNTTGTANTALGSNALGANSTGTDNTALGLNALFNSTGNLNIGIGSAAGLALTTGSGNIYIGNGGANESSTIRIGAAQTATFIAGITFATVDPGTGTAVFSDANGKLGSVVSTRRAKEDIRDMGEASAGLLRLRPVTFRYKQPSADGSKPIQYGLIAEEVADAMPELVIYGQDGQPQTVKYHELPALLLNELQRQETEVAELRQLVAAQAAELAELKAALRSTLAAKATTAEVAQQR